MRSTLFAVGMFVGAVTPLTGAEAQREAPVMPMPTLHAPSRSLRLTPDVVDGPYLVRSSLLGQEDTHRGMSAAKKGALIGAGTGFVAGVYGGFRLAETFGCSAVLGAPPCHERRQELGAIMGVTVVGTGLGALVGAGVGWLIHIARGGAAPGQ